MYLYLSYYNLLILHYAFLQLDPLQTNKKIYTPKEKKKTNIMVSLSFMYMIKRKMNILLFIMIILLLTNIYYVLAFSHNNNEVRNLHEEQFTQYQAIKYTTTLKNISTQNITNKCRGKHYTSQIKPIRRYIYIDG